MTPENYIRKVVNDWSIPTGPRRPGAAAANELYPYIVDWAEGFFVDLYPSGSYAKETAIKGGSDIDLFLSLSSNLGMPLRDIFTDFGRHLRQLRFNGRKLNVRKQNVSQRVTLHGVKIDIVPARRQSSNGNGHRIYVRRRDTYTLTDVTKHISLIHQSQRHVEIKAIKIWRKLRKLRFPSFVLELAVVDALYGRRVGKVEDNLLTVFDYLATRFPRARIEDPGNSNNIVSQDMSDTAKRAVADAALRSLQAQGWADIIR